MVRLFVSGVPPDTPDAELIERFTPFGTVDSCHFAGPKKYGKDTFTRTFVFMNINLKEPEDQTLKKLLKTYNNCKWQGYSMRCEVATEDRLNKYINERNAINEHPAASTTPQMCEMGTTIKIFNPDTRKLATVTLGGRPVKIQRLNEAGHTTDNLTLAAASTEQQHQQPGTNIDRLSNKTIVTASWEPLETPKNARYTFEQRLIALAPKQPSAAQKAHDVDIEGTLDDNVNAAIHAAQQRPKPQQQKSAIPFNYAKESLQYDDEPSSGGSELSDWLKEISPDEQQQTAVVDQPIHRPAAIQTRKDTKQGERVEKQVATTERQKSMVEVVGREKNKPAVVAQQRQQQHQPEKQQPAKRVRTVDFASEEEVAAIKSRREALDLSRFDSDTDEDDRPAGAAGGKLNTMDMKMIPQVDGAGDTDSSSSDDDDDSKGSESDTTSTMDDAPNKAITSDDDGSDGGSGGTNTTTTTSEEEGEESEEDVEAVVKGGDIPEKQNLKGSDIEKKRQKFAEEEIPVWLERALPAAAGFYCKENMAKVEATWRASREVRTREWKERQKQAMRLKKNKTSTAKRD